MRWLLTIFMKFSPGKILLWSPFIFSWFVMNCLFQDQQVHFNKTIPHDQFILQKFPPFSYFSWEVLEKSNHILALYVQFLASQKGSGSRCQKLDLFAMELLIRFWSASSPCQFWCQSFLLRWKIFPFCFGFTGRFSILGCTSWWTDSRHLGCCRSDVTWTAGSLFV